MLAGMAVLEKLPEMHVIKGMKGTVDFYEWKGIAVARKWPRKAIPTQTPAELETWNFFRAMTQSYKDLAPLVIHSLNAMVMSSSQRNFDLYQSGQYGHQYAYINPMQIADTEEDSMTAIPIAYSPSATATTLAVNNTIYTTLLNLTFLIPFSQISFNRYKLVLRGLSNAAGQTIDARIQEFATGIPLGDGTPDLSIINLADMYDSGNKVINSAPASDAQYALVLKGSNATVDLTYFWATLYVWQEL